MSPRKPSPRRQVEQSVLLMLMMMMMQDSLPRSGSSPRSIVHRGPVEMKPSFFSRPSPDPHPLQHRIPKLRSSQGSESWLLSWKHSSPHHGSPRTCSGSWSRSPALHPPLPRILSEHQSVVRGAYVLSRPGCVSISKSPRQEQSAGAGGDILLFTQSSRGTAVSPVQVHPSILGSSWISQAVQVSMNSSVWRQWVISVSSRTWTQCPQSSRLARHTGSCSESLSPEIPSLP